MKINLGLAAALAGGAMLALSGGFAPSGSAAASAPMYQWFYYSDATMTQTVGWSQDICVGSNVMQGPLSGRPSPYLELVLVGTCTGGFY